MNRKIYAGIFDMDGTMIDTEKIKENGWKYAGECQNIIIDDKILSEMRGTNKEYCKEFYNIKINIPINELKDNLNMLL